MHPRPHPPGPPPPPDPPYRPPVGREGWKAAGKELLSKVKKQPLSEFLAAHRWRDCGKRNTDVLGIPAIDAIINEILNPVLPNPANFPKRLRLPVIEISSRGSLGKTQLLYYICAVSTLPAGLGGKDSAVVVIDCAGKFDAKRLYVVIAEYARKQQDPTAAVPLGQAELHKAVLTALTHVHVFQPTNSGQLLATIAHIKPYLLGATAQRHRSRAKEVACIMVDAASRFIWEDRFHAYGAVMVEPDDAAWIDLWARYEAITHALRAAAAALCCFVVVTDIGFNLKFDRDRAPVLHAPGERRAPQYRPARITPWHRYFEPWRLELPPRPPSFARPYLAHVLPQPWTAFVNVKLVLQREKADCPRFPRGISMREAVRRREAHVAAVQNAGIVGFANPVGLGGGVQKAVQTANGGTGCFHLYIRKDGVDVTV